MTNNKQLIWAMVTVICVISFCVTIVLVNLYSPPGQPMTINKLMADCVRSPEARHSAFCNALIQKVKVDPTNAETKEQ